MRAAGGQGKTKRERTRAKLIDATARLIGANGADAVTIADITDAAGVAKGTFYNYFDDRDQIIVETAMSIMDVVADSIHEAGLDESDPIERFVRGGRRFLEFVRRHPTSAGAVLRSVDYLPSLRPKVYEQVGMSISAGKEVGAFGMDDWLTVFIINSMLFAAARADLAGEAPADVGPRTSEMQLLLLGTAPARAKAAAYGDVPSIDFGAVD